jgi:D-alanyl-lipoteichoic acid acyltransferase DltB (MBOAT superfamily)
VLFNSPDFIFKFLPIALIGTWLLAGLGYRMAAFGWLTLTSIVFYGWFNPEYVILLFISIGVNYMFGERILRHQANMESNIGRRWFLAGLIFNLGLLGWYKYANFFVDTIVATGLSTISLPEILLPIGISFFTFQQIAYLMDCRAGIAHRSGILKYSLFVVYFPQLIAGPIVHPNSILPQFENEKALRFNIGHFCDGLTIFLLGLGKKVILADALSAWATEGFEAVASGKALTLVEAWAAVLSYTLQIYFDFSGYSDMAIGLALMVGIRLPINFNSPYQAKNIIDFWRRWHITLSTFLRDYLYIPLGGNRSGPTRRWVNLFITMLLGGLWHGAGWTFVLWGGLHGLYLAANHAWSDARRRWIFPNQTFGIGGRLLAWFTMMLGVMVAWVFFRASDITSALAVLKGMSGLNGMALPEELKSMIPTIVGEHIQWTQGLPNLASGSRTGLAEVLGYLALASGIAIFCKPLHRLKPSTRRLLLIPVAALALQKVIVSSSPSEFLYFQF